MISIIIISMNNTQKELTVQEAVRGYLFSVQEARSENTARVYANALAAFLRVLSEHWINGDSPVNKINENGIAWMLSYLKVFASSTERLYTQAVKGFYQYLASEQLAVINLPRLELIIHNRARRSGQRLPQFPREDIEAILASVEEKATTLSDNYNERLRALRDRAFLLTLADTGLRVHEACSLHRGDIDWNEGRALIIGKGDKQAVIRFSSRCLNSLTDYLRERSSLDGLSGRPLSSLPLFSRHDKGAGKKIKPITTTTGRNIVTHASQILGEKSMGHITPHSFRHYFVTTVLRASGNLKLAQELARHSNIQVTQRYAHLSNDELDKGYYEIFEGEHSPDDTEH